MHADQYNPDIYHRRSIRLRGYDYSQAGAYFVTICTMNKECLFGEIGDGGMVLNEAGQVAVDEWLRSAYVRGNIELDSFVVMPNHIHGIVVITDGSGANRPVGASQRFAPTEMPRPPKPNSIGAIICQFKSLVTKRINTILDTPGESVWQRNYYEHVIRNEKELNRIREYIMNNPVQWELDEENPDCAEQDSKDFPKTGQMFSVGARRAVP